MSGGCCMPGWLARRLVCCVAGRDAGQWPRLCGGPAAAAAAGRLRVRGMSAKRGVEGQSPATGTARHRKRPCGGAAAAADIDFIPISHTPPPPHLNNNNNNNDDDDILDLGDFIFIDTTPTPVHDAPLPPSWPRPRPRRHAAPEVVVVAGSPPSGGDIAVVYEGPGRGRTTTTTSPQVTPRRGCHTRARRGIKTQAPVQGPAPAPVVEDEVEVVVEEEEESDEVQVVTPPPPREVEVVDLDAEEEEEEEAVVVGGGGGGVVEEEGQHSDDGGDGGGVVAGGSSVEVRREGFVSLGAVSVGGLTNTTIDLTDEVLARRRRLEAVRGWEETGLGRHVALHGLRGGSLPLTVLSYNVLAQRLLRANPGLYRGCDEEHLSWEYRWALLQHEVHGLSPDVLLLQEVEAAHYLSHYLPWLAARGYRGIYKKRTGDKADGCAIFYRSAKWRLVEHRGVEYCQPHAPEVLDRDNVGLVARLVPRHGAQRNGPGLVVATTHLLYNPRRHDVKLAQAAVMMAELDRLCFQGHEAGRPQYCPVLLTGDFNAEPHSAVLTFLKEGRLQYEGLNQRTLARHGGHGPTLGPALLPPALGITAACQHASLAQGRWLEAQRGPLFSQEDRRRLEEDLIHLSHSDRPAPPNPAATAADPLQPPGWLSHGFMMQSVYRGRRQGRDGSPEVTTFQDRWCCVDYMLYSRRPGLDGMPVEGRLKLLARLALPSARHAQEYGPMPSDVCPSDHFPLAAKFILTTT